MGKAERHWVSAQEELGKTQQGQMRCSRRDPRQVNLRRTRSLEELSATQEKILNARRSLPVQKGGYEVWWEFSLLMNSLIL